MADQQQPNDIRRATQHRLRDDARLPAGRDDAGKIVSEGALKRVLVAVDSFGAHCWATAAAIAERTGRWGNRLSRRTVISALQALVRLDVLAREEGRGTRGSKAVEYRVVWQNLCRYSGDELGEPGALHEQPSALGARPSALGARPSALGARPSALGARPSALECTLSADKAPKKLQEAPSEAPVDGEGGAKIYGDRDFFDPSDGSLNRLAGRDPQPAEERYFFGDEIAAVRAKANEINAWFCARTLTDRELVLKVATLCLDRELPDDTIEQVLESFQRKRDLGKPIDNPRGWFWATLRGQCQRHGIHLEKLLACTPFPRELLPPPAMQTEQSP